MNRGWLLGFIAIVAIVLCSAKSIPDPGVAISVPVKILEIVDGDTIRVDPAVSWTINLEDCWAPSVTGAEAFDGLKSKNALVNLLQKDGYTHFTALINLKTAVVVPEPEVGKWPPQELSPWEHWVYADRAYSFGSIQGSIYAHYQPNNSSNGPGIPGDVWTVVDLGKWMVDNGWASKTRKAWVQ